ncbi:uncharacterized protein SPPG_07797 [Spizellomyces punctatus DAOM BR117]|uniref:TPX2 C-terminal domain-containing protein n=1 Tax=Spizellomyces punctatus (strain DAOM BR117) TaxID=645134 RepID=A0A0L0H7N7_SPIPD|nr:uncharacterized protein SPPG_07797 [Spizellomyces punctatus DAOM BR117]KNC96979.1 hypothetical protein SPPG_07797 [Spizellomyces punctatus DAOM BR117]|eukprot:XP_016605019.1 hypothetical protein SPPG_07797 [Spizellomyces punctatus DAOM BR117]
MTPRPKPPRRSSLTPRPLKTLSLYPVIHARLPKETTGSNLFAEAAEQRTVGSDDTDANYEFNAPQFHDFLKEESETGIDSWFDARITTPASTIFAEDNHHNEGDDEFHEEFSVQESTPKASQFLANLGLTQPECKQNTSASNFANPFASANQRLSSSSSSADESVKPERTKARDTKPREGKPVAEKMNQTQKRRGLTVPKEFSFASRLRTKDGLGMRSPGGVQKKKPIKRMNGMTVPRPFNFHSTLRTLANDVTQPKSPYVPLAVKVKSFEANVPERFKAKPGPAKVFSAVSSPWRGHVRMTKPRSPYLLTKLRKKTHTVPSREEQELAELAKIQPFKAKPVDRKILASDRPIGVPAVPKSAPTIPQSPAITKPRPPPAPEPSPPRIVKANPIPKKIFQPFEPVVEHRVIVPPEFSLPGDEISRRKKIEFEERVKREKEEEERAKQFRAYPLPYDEPDPLPSVPHRPITNPQPFNLETEIRGSFARLTIEEKRERELREQERMRQFRANPLPCLDPFIPQPSNRPLTDVENVLLHTDVRAEERRAFEESRKQREAIEQKMREEMAKDDEEREKEQIRLLRKQQVHKAQPVLYDKMKPLNVKPSTKKLTEPESPFIGEKRKKAMQAQQHPQLGTFGCITGGGGSKLQARLLEEAARSHK